MSADNTQHPWAGLEELDRLDAEGVVDEVLDTLKQLRGEPGRLSTLKLSRHTRAVQILGGGSPELVMSAISSVAKEAKGDREIEAALAHLGFGTEDGSVTDRLKAFAKANFTEHERTVIRWSDAGLPKLAHLVANTSLSARPRLKLALMWNMERLTLVVLVTPDEHAISLIRILVEGEIIIDLNEFKRLEPGQTELVLKRVFDFPDIESGQLLKVHVICSAPRHPLFTLQVIASTPLVSLKSMSVGPASMALIWTRHKV